MQIPRKVQTLNRPRNFLYSESHIRISRGLTIKCRYKQNTGGRNAMETHYLHKMAAPTPSKAILCFRTANYRNRAAEIVNAERIYA